MKKGILTN